MTTKVIDNFKKKGYAVVKNAVSKELVDFATQYALFDEAQNFTPDRQQVLGAHAKYADPAMEAMLLNLHSSMEKYTGLTLYPTYSFYRVYRNGDTLEKHIDRPSCEISATMCLGYSYDDRKFQWPIYMDGTSVSLKPGDLVIYRGVDLEHWREELKYEEDVWHVQGFFHYVDANGPYPEYKFDERESIGVLKTPRIGKNIHHKSYIEYL